MLFQIFKILIKTYLFKEKFHLKIMKHVNITI